MLTAPSILCRVVRPFAAPIVARPADVLSVWPGHPTHTLAVLTPDCDRIIRHGYCPESKLYGEILSLFLDAAIRLPVQAQRALLSRSA